MTALALAVSSFVGIRTLASPERGLAPLAGDTSQSPGTLPYTRVVGMTAFTLSASDDRSNGVSLDLKMSDGNSTGMGNIKIEKPSDISLSPEVVGNDTVVYGAVSSQVDRIVVSPDARSPIDATMLTVPESVAPGLRAFVAVVPGAPRGSIAGIDAAGTSLFVEPYLPGLASWPGGGWHPSGDPSIVFEGHLAGVAWMIVPKADGGVALLDPNQHELSSTDGGLPAGDALSLAPSSGTANLDGSGNIDGRTTLLYGLASGDVTQVKVLTGGFWTNETLTPVPGVSNGIQAWFGGFRHCRDERDRGCARRRLSGARDAGCEDRATRRHH
jgi:hypothetical protein